MNVTPVFMIVFIKLKTRPQNTLNSKIFPRTSLVIRLRPVGTSARQSPRYHLALPAIALLCPSEAFSEGGAKAGSGHFMTAITGLPGLVYLPRLYGEDSPLNQSFLQTANLVTNQTQTLYNSTITIDK